MDVRSAGRSLSPASALVSFQTLRI
jgi:hypothetical protein